MLRTSTQAFWHLGYGKQILGLYQAAVGSQVCLPYFVIPTSSECAFLQGGMTITKQRNRLKGDIVEALQYLKCLIQHNLLFW